MEVKENWRNLAYKMTKQAGKMLRERWNEERKVLKRTAGDIKIRLDREVEDKLIELIQKSEDDFSILGEERGEIGSSDLRWIIDPLDGTVNYYYGIPFFNTTVALEREGELLLGIIYDPLRDELYYAEKDKGAFLNDEPIQTSDRSFENSMICVSALREGRKFKLEKKLLEAGNLRKFGSGALSLAYVASGRLDAYINFYTRPWDVAAGILLEHEAGGKVTDLKGNKPELDGRSFVFSNGKIHEQILEKL